MLQAFESSKNGGNKLHKKCKSTNAETTVCLSSMIKQIKNSRKLNRVIINEQGLVEPKINMKRNLDAQ